RLGQPCFAGSSLETLFRGDARRLAHSAMQRERRRAVKTSPTGRRGFSKGLGRTRQLGLRAPRKPNSWKYKNNKNRDCTGKTTTPVFRIVCLINRLDINFRNRGTMESALRINGICAVLRERETTESLAFLGSRLASPRAGASRADGKGVY